MWIQTWSHPSDLSGLSHTSPSMPQCPHLQSGDNAAHLHRAVLRIKRDSVPSAKYTHSIEVGVSTISPKYTHSIEAAVNTIFQGGLK